MPFYEYECPSCKYYLEVLQKIGDKPLKKCPSCGKTGFKRLMSAPVFRLKGSGWYETDFKSDKDNQRNLAGAEREENKPAPEEKATAVVDAKTTADSTNADSAKAAGEAAKSAPATPAKTDQAEKSAADSKSGGERTSGGERKPGGERKSGGDHKSQRGSVSGSGAKRLAQPAARSSAKPAAKRAAKRPAKAATRGSRRR